MSSESNSFRVIVVGAGVSGLAASHALQLAGIDHVVLEKRSTVAPHEGASIAMYPHGGRILNQFGCLEAVQKHTTPPGRWWARLPSGKLIADNSVFRVIEENHGTGLLLIERRQFLQELYDNLPDKTVVRTSTVIDEIRQDSNGVEVVLSSGEVEKGDLLIGCDGVYSFVREIMWNHANKTTPGLITVEEKRAIKANWKCLVVMTTAIPELGDRDLTVVHNDNYSHMFTMTPTAGYFFVFFRLDTTATFPTMPRYTDQDAHALAAKIANHAVSETVMFGEVWKRRIRANVVNLEEGVLDHWYHGRIALAGDSVHKVTPNMAFGGNSGLESVVVLVNHLRRLLVENNWKKPSSEALEKALAGYQQERKDRMVHIKDFSGDITDVQAWHKWWHKLISTWLVPHAPRGFFGNQLGEIIRGAPKLDFVDSADFPSGRLPFKDENQSLKVGKAVTKVSASGPRPFGWVTAAAAALITVFYVATTFPLITAQVSATPA